MQDYGLERVEGLLLRHLTSAYKVLRQTVPDSMKCDAVVDIELYLRDMVRQVDSSLLEEWERMRDPDYQAPGSAEAEVAPRGREPNPDVTRDARSFTAAIRTQVFTFLRAWSFGTDEAALEVLDSGVDDSGARWTPARLAAARDAFRVEHGNLRLDPEARNLRHTHVHPSDDGTTWRIAQMLIDMEGLNDWVAEFDVGLDASRETGQPVMTLVRLESLVP